MHKFIDSFFFFVVPGEEKMGSNGARPTKELSGLGPDLGRAILRFEGEKPLGKQIEGGEGRAARREERLNVEADAIVGYLATPLVLSLGGRYAAQFFIWIIPHCPLAF